MFRTKIIFVMAMFLFIIGCRTAPIMEVVDSPFNYATSAQPTLSQVTNQIVGAGVELGWQMRKVRPGYLIATLYIRKHMVKVDINYTTTEYSITYKDSSNLKFDGEKIHSNYNGWVTNLSATIRKNVNQMIK